MPRYFRPATLDDALRIRADHAVTVLAGGTDVYPAKAARAGWGDMRHPDVLDIGALDPLRWISEEGGKIRFGSLVTWTELRRATLPPAFAGYKAAAREIGGAQIQNRGTLVGNICTASPAGDGIPCLLALDAEVELASLDGRRVVPIAEFITDYRKTVLRSDEIITALLIPRPHPKARGAFLKLGARRYLVISIVMAAAVIAADKEGIITAARIAVGACTPVARRLQALEGVLIGRTLADASDNVTADHLAELEPIDDIRATARFRQVAALGLVSDLLAGFTAGVERRAA